MASLFRNRVEIVCCRLQDLGELRKLLRLLELLKV